jgi:catechol 2,3-dioxygenase-like lactoylglutathione lyase family enzyme
MDHVGTRVTRAEDCYRWYAETLGFIGEVMHYPARSIRCGTDRLRNGRKRSEY